MRERYLSGAEVIGMLAQLGIPEGESVALLQAQDIPALKGRIKKAWHARAFTLHPDRGGDAEEFKRLAAIYSMLQKVHWVQAAPRPPRMGGIFDGSPVRIEVVFSGGGWTTYTSAGFSTTSWHRTGGF